MFDQVELSWRRFIHQSVYIMPIIGAMGIFIPYLIGFSYFSIFGLYLLIPLLLSPLFYHINSTNNIWENSPSVINSRLIYKFSSIIFFVTYGVSLWIAVYSDTRPTSYYILIAFLGTLTLLEILYFKLRPVVISVFLFKICIISLNISLNMTLKYPFFIGHTDLSAHAANLSVVLSERGLSGISATYEAFPLWYLYNVIFYDIVKLNISLNKYPLLLGGLIYGIGLVISYTATRRIVSDTRIALLSALFLLFNHTYVFYSMYAIPRGIVAVLLLAIISSVFAVDSIKRKYILLYVLTLAVIIYHPASIPFFGLLIFAFTAVEYASNSYRQYFPIPYVLLTGIFTLLYWMYQANFIFERLVGIVLARLFAESSNDGTIFIIEFPWAELFNHLHLSILWTFVIVGTVWVLLATGFDLRIKLIVAIGVLFSTLGMPGPAFLVDVIPSVNISRFDLYTYLFVTIAAAIGFYGLFSSSKRTVHVLLIILFFSMCFLTVSNDYVASDNPTIEREFYTQYLKESELAGYDTVNSYYRDPLLADRPSCRYLTEVKGYPQCQRADPDLYSQTDSSGLLVRTGELEKRPLQFTEYTYADHPMWDRIDTRNRVYSSGSIDLYH